MTQQQTVSKEEHQQFLKELKLFHKINGWASLPRKAKCDYCKEYHHEVADNIKFMGLKACHTCALVEERKRLKQQLQDLENVDSSWAKYLRKETLEGLAFYEDRNTQQCPTCEDTQN